jgi:hypothetical protein
MKLFRRNVSFALEEKVMSNYKAIIVNKNTFGNLHAINSLLAVKADVCNWSYE